MDQLAQNNGEEKKCTIHKRYGLNFARLVPNKNEDLFCCSVCVIKGQDKNMFISVEEVIANDQTFPISNWPPGMSEMCFEFLNQKQHSMLRDKLQDNIREFYKRLSDQINRAIIESEKQQLIELDNHDVSSDDAIEMYNTLFKRTELFEIFSQRTEDCSERYLKLLNTINESAQNDLQCITNKIKEKISFEDSFINFQCNKVSDLYTKIGQILEDLQCSLFKPTIPDSQQNQEKPPQLLSLSKLSKQESLKNEKIQEELMHLRLQLNQYQNKSDLMLVDKSNLFTIDYEDNDLISINNPQQKSGFIQSFFSLNNQCKYTLRLGFESLLAFSNFTVGIIKDIQDFEVAIQPFQELCQQMKFNLEKHIKVATPIEIQLLVDLSENLFKLKHEATSIMQIFNLDDNIQDHSNLFVFQINNNCKGFTIKRYKEKYKCNNIS